jgi:hypothetical protein
VIGGRLPMAAFFGAAIGIYRERRALTGNFPLSR